MTVRRPPRPLRHMMAFGERSMGAKTNVLLVHGAWADGSCWAKVIPLLQAKD